MKGEGGLSDTNIQINCPCQNAVPSSHADRQCRKEFLELKNQCPALKHVIFPDETIFPKVEIGPLKQDSIFFSMYVGGRLERLTRPIHEFLFEGIEPKLRGDIKKSYLMDSL